MSEHRGFDDMSVELDVGNLCVLKAAHLKILPNSEKNLEIIATLGVQKLINEIFKLPSEYHTHIPVAKLPEPTFLLPREKPIPTEKPLTKWEQFAKQKGIVKKKKENAKWDESTNDFIHRYGYNKEKQNDDWMIEVPESGDPNKDYFAEVREKKKERIAKNEYQRLRNVARASKMKVTNLESVDQANKEQLARSMSAAKTATASIGRFTENLPKEKPPKDTMEKRKFKSNTANFNTEKDNNLKLFADLEKKAPKLNVQEAVQRYMYKPLKERTEEQAANSQKRRKTKKSKYIHNKMFRGGNKNKKNFKQR